MARALLEPLVREVTISRGSTETFRSRLASATALELVVVSAKLTGHRPVISGVTSIETLSPGVTAPDEPVTLVAKAGALP